MANADKAAISQGQIRRHQRQRRQLGPPPGKKRCSQCKRIKQVPDDYPIRRRKLASGEIRFYPAGECLKCNAERSAKWRKQLRADPAAARRAYKRWNKNRDHAKRRKYSREYQRMQRALAGVPTRGPWKRYRNEAPERPMADPTFFLEWVLLAKPIMDDDEARRVRAVGHEQTHLTLEFMDRIMTRNGAAALFTQLYGDPKSPRFQYQLQVRRDQACREGLLDSAA